MTEQLNHLEQQTTEPQTISKSLFQAWIAHVKGDHATAEVEFKKALELDPDSIDALYGFGLTQKMLGNKENAITNFQKALDLLTKEASGGKLSRVPMLRYMTQAQLHMLGK